MDRDSGGDKTSSPVVNDSIRSGNVEADTSGFACPFYKYDPLFYSGKEWRTCMAGRFEISRLKCVALTY